VIFGEVASAVDTKVTNAGDPLSVFTLKVDRPERQDGIQSQSDLMKVVCWGPLSSHVENAEEGTSVFVEGQINNKQYDDQNNVRHYETEIVAKEVMVVSNMTPQLSPNSPPLEAAVPPADTSNDIETLNSSARNFDFSDTASSPPEFGDPVEEDIPF
jgi:single-strand DNA-binding protein